MENTKNKIYYLDVLRTIACLAVVMIHTSATYVSKNFGSCNFWVANILDSLSRIGVPFFIMISGAIMLDERYICTLKKVKSHIIRMVLFFVFWSFVYCLIFRVIKSIFVGGYTYLMFLNG